MIAYQASKVRTFERNGERLTAASLHDHLVIFARDLLEVLAGDVSLALNRLAIGQSNRDGSKLGKLLLRARPPADRPTRQRADRRRQAGRVACGSWMPTRRIIYAYGLIVSDLHVRMLLGEPGLKDTSRQAEKAVSAFLRLYGTEKVLAKRQRPSEEFTQR